MVLMVTVVVVSFMVIAMVMVFLVVMMVLVVMAMVVFFLQNEEEGKRSQYKSKRLQIFLSKNIHLQKFYIYKSEFNTL